MRGLELGARDDNRSFWNTGHPEPAEELSILSNVHAVHRRRVGKPRQRVLSDHHAVAYLDAQGEPIAAASYDGAGSIVFTVHEKGTVIVIR